MSDWPDSLRPILYPFFDSGRDRIEVEVEKVELLHDFYRDVWAAEKIDQTLTPVAECSIEIILRKTA